MNEWEIEYSVEQLEELKPSLMRLYNCVNPHHEDTLTIEDRYVMRDMLLNAILQIDFLTQAVKTDTNPNPPKKRFWHRRK